MFSAKFHGSPNQQKYAKPAQKYTNIRKKINNSEKSMWHSSESFRGGPFLQDFVINKTLEAILECAQRTPARIQRIAIPFQDDAIQWIERPSTGESSGKVHSCSETYTTLKEQRNTKKYQKVKETLYLSRSRLYTVYSCIHPSYAMHILMAWPSRTLCPGRCGVTCVAWLPSRESYAAATSPKP